MNLANMLQKLQNIEQGVATTETTKTLASENNQDLVNVLKGLAAIQENDTEQVAQEGVMSEIDIDMQEIASSQDFDKLEDALSGQMGRATQQYLQDMMMDIARDSGLHYDDDIDRIMEILMDRLVERHGADLDEQGVNESQLEECGMGYEMPKQELDNRYTLSVQRGDKNLNVTTDNPEELLMIMRLAGIDAGSAMTQTVATEEFANTPDTTKEREPRAYGDIRDWGRKGTGSGQPGSALNKPFGQGDNPLSEQAMFEEYRRFKQGK